MEDRIPELATRLKSLRKSESRVDFARRIGESDSTLGNYERGSRTPSADFLARLKEATGVDLNWLVSGDLSSQSQRQALSIGSKDALPAGFVPVPLLDVRPSAGPGSLTLPTHIEPDVYGFREEWLRRIGVTPRAARLMIAKGDSMYDTISDGDLMIVDVSIRAIVDEGIYVVVFGGMVLVKRVQILRTGSIVLKSDNARYSSDEVKPHELPELVIEGRVRWAGGSL